MRRVFLPLALAFALASAFACNDGEVGVRNSPPEATIVLPQAAATLFAGDELTFEGRVGDGVTRPENLEVVWTSSIDGTLLEGSPDNTGTTTFTAQLTPGAHTLQLTAIDAQGAGGSDAVDVTVCTPSTWFRDWDEDGWGSELTERGCEAPPGYVADPGDCDDFDAEVHPWAGDEAGDGLDPDCDGLDCTASDGGSVYYVVCSDPATWWHGQAACDGSRRDGLASILSAAEQDVLASILQRIGLYDTQGHWIGLQDQDEEGTFVWEDGSPLDFTHWRDIDPDNRDGEEHCVHLYAGDNAGLWNDNLCDKGLGPDSATGGGVLGFVCSERR